MTTITADEVVIDGLNKATGNKVRLDGFGLRINARKITIKNLIIENTKEFRYALLSTGDTEHLEITDSEVYDSYGVAIIGEVTDLILKRNIFSMVSNQSSTPTGRGMNIEKATHVMIGGNAEDANVFSNFGSTSGLLIDTILAGEISYNEFSGNSSSGLRARLVKDVNILNNHAYDNEQIGIFFSDATNVDFIENELENNGRGGLVLGLGTDIKIVENEMTNNGIYGLSVDEVDGLELRENDILNNRPLASGFGGFGILASGRCDNINVSENIVSDNADAGMSWDSIVVGTIESNTLEKNGSEGVEIDYGRDVEVLENTFNGHIPDGFRISRAVGLELKDNVITNTQSLANGFGGYGIRGSRRCDDIVVAGNIVSDNSNIGMRWDSVVVGIFEDNTLDQNTSGGLQLRYAQDVAIRHNSVSNTSSADGAPSAEGINLVIDHVQYY